MAWYFGDDRKEEPLAVSMSLPILQEWKAVHCLQSGNQPLARFATCDIRFYAKTDKRTGILVCGQDGELVRFTVGTWRYLADKKLEVVSTHGNIWLFENVQEAPHDNV